MLTKQVAPPGRCAVIHAPVSLLSRAIPAGNTGDDADALSGAGTAIPPHPRASSPGVECGA